MTDDQIFRATLIGVFLLVIPIGAYHRVQSQKTREKLDRRQEGVFILATLRPLGFACWLAVVVWMINPGWMHWSAYSSPSWTRSIGAVLFILGCALMIWTFRSLGTNLTDTVVTRQVHTLVSHGPYRWIRHPLYSSTLLLTTGIGLATANWFILGTGVLVFAIIVLRTSIEERHLLARFGEDYRAYMERTGRFLPKGG